MVLVAARAHATIIFAEPNDMGYLDRACAAGANAGTACAMDTECPSSTCSAADTHLWVAIEGMIAPESTILDATSGNRYALVASPGGATATPTATPTVTASRTNATATPTVTVTSTAATASPTATATATPIGGVAYVEASVPTDPTVVPCMRFRVDTVPTIGRRLLTLKKSTGEIAAFLELDPHTGSTSLFDLKAYYKDSLPKCTGSQTMDDTPCARSCTVQTDCAIGRPNGTCNGGANYGTVCTDDSMCPGATCDATNCRSGACVNECDESHPGESTCGPVAYAQLLSLSTGIWWLACVGEDNTGGASPGEVRVGLWAGTAGQSPQNVERGSPKRKQGTCSAASTNAHYACVANTDCPSGTCTTTNVVQPDRVRFGFDDTVNAAAVAYLDDMVIDNNGIAIGFNPNYRIESLLLIGEGGSAGNWSTLGSANGCGLGAEWKCVKPSPTPDGSNGAIQNNNAAKPTIGFTFAPPASATATPTSTAATPMPTGPTPTPGPTVAPIVIFDAVAQNQLSSITVRLDPIDNVGIDRLATFGAAFDYAGFPDSGSGANYHYMPPVLALSKCDNASCTSATTNWDANGLNNVGLEIFKTAGSSNNGRITAISAAVWWDLFDPQIPSVLHSDANGNIPVGVTGDSTVEPDNFYTALIGNVLQMTDLYRCARGGTTPGDIEANRASIFAGSGSGYMKCTAFKGAVGKTLRYLFIESGVNAFRGGNWGDPCNSATHYGRRHGGYCDDAGGPKEGNACYCGRSSIKRTETGEAYCRTRNGSFLRRCSCHSTADCLWGTCSASSGFGYCNGGYNICSCTVNADCGPNGVCLATKQCRVGDGTGSALSCDVNPSTAPAPGPYGVNTNDMCAPGCLGAPGCETGLCISNSSEDDDFQSLITTVQAAIAAGITPILVAPPPGQTLTSNGSNRPGSACWHAIEDKVGKWRDRVLTYARDHSINYIDLWARFYRDAPGGKLLQSTVAGDANDVNAMIKDGIHWTDSNGIPTAISAYSDCLTNASGPSDGTCTAGVCTTGRVNDRCTDNDGCNTYKCVM